MKEEIDDSTMWIATVDTNKLLVHVKDPANNQMVLECLEKAYYTKFHLVSEYGPDPDVVILDCPEDNWVIMPVSRKPHDWTWQKFVEVAKKTNMLIVLPSKREGDSIGIFPKKETQTV